MLYKLLYMSKFSQVFCLQLKPHLECLTLLGKRNKSDTALQQLNQERARDIEDVCCVLGRQFSVDRNNRRNTRWQFGNI